MKSEERRVKSEERRVKNSIVILSSKTQNSKLKILIALAIHSPLRRGGGSRQRRRGGGASAVGLQGMWLNHHRSPPPPSPLPTVKRRERRKEKKRSDALYVTSYSYFIFSSTHLRALTKASIHGVTSSARRSRGYHAFCHGKMARSRCGIIARWRPSLEQMPATL